ncbi:MAG: TonB-dependent receptor, partial [Proteobacteria bacterium]|nr:TonB-dependent receptor [Pseudomonadota bacterium]
MKQIIFLFSACMIFTMAGLVFSQEMPYRLDDIVVTASRIETPLKEAPANITVITSEEMEQKGAATLIDVFKEEPGLSTKSWTGTIKQSNIDIRGYGEAAPQNVLFLIDGRRVNNVDMSGADLAQIPVGMIERIEIYRGSASVMFGDNASAGAVNIILKKGEGKPKVTAKMLGGSYNLFAPGLSVAGGDKKLSYFLLTSSYDTDGYRENQAVQMKDIFGNFSVDPLKNLTINIKTGYHKDKYGMPGPVLWQNLINGIAKRTDAGTPFDNASTEDSFFDMEADIKLAEDVKFSIGGSYRNRHSASYFDYGTFGFNESKGQLETYGFTPRIVIDKPYVSERIYPLSNLTLDIGYRVHKAIYDSRYTDYFTPTNSTTYHTHQQKEAFRASVNYAFNEAGNAFITYAKGFRFPTTDELLNIQTGAITTNLNPQTGWEVNIGARWNPFKRLGGSLTIFQSKNKDEIFYNPYTFTNANYERTKRQGVETQLNFIVTENLKFGVGYSYIDTKFDGKQFIGGADVDGNSIPLVPKNKFSANISYSFNSFIINLITVYTGNRYTISDQLNSHRELPGYTTCDMNISYKYKNLEALFGIKNLTGKEYSEFGVASTTS